MFSWVIVLVSELIGSWRKGGKTIRWTIGAAIIFVGIAVGVAVTGQLVDINKKLLEIITSILSLISMTIIVGVLGYQKSLDKTKREERVEAAEERVRVNPKETQAAWELAQTKLESYINRNLTQIRSIFWLTVLVMLFGFALICYGVFQAFETPDVLGPSILTACSGLIVNFIGATFLVVFKSTMSQAQEYMRIIERINAVGMSVQILDTISEKADVLKDKTTSDISQKLLELYGTK